MKDLQEKKSIKGFKNLFKYLSYFKRYKWLCIGFWASLIVGNYSFLVSEKFNALFLFLFMLLSCFLLVAEIPLFALKFKTLSWEDNKVKYIFILTCIPLAVALGAGCFAPIIAWYVILSLFTGLRSKE